MYTCLFYCVGSICNCYTCIYIYIILNGSEFKYSGIIFNNKLIFDTHINQI